jgi:hypothetical protein
VQKDFDTITGKPWVYWLSAGIRSSFKRLPKVGDVATTAVGQNTGDNARFLRFWWEVASETSFGTVETKLKLKVLARSGFPT